MVLHRDGVDRRLAQLLDPALAEHAGDLADDDGKERDEGDDGKPERHPAENRRGDEQVDDEPLEPEPERERHEAAEAGHEHAAPGQAAPRRQRHERAVGGLDRLHRLLGDDDGAAALGRGLVGAHGHDVRVVEPEGAGLTRHER